MVYETRVVSFNKASPNIANIDVTLYKYNQWVASTQEARNMFLPLLRRDVVEMVQDYLAVVRDQR